jgi:hypothetical protein
MKQRRKKQKKQPKSFSIINPDAAGIDIGSAEHWVAVPADRDQHPVQAEISERESSCGDCFPILIWQALDIPGFGSFSK